MHTMCGYITFVLMCNNVTHDGTVVHTVRYINWARKQATHCSTAIMRMIFVRTISFPLKIANAEMNFTVKCSEQHLLGVLATETRSRHNAIEQRKDGSKLKSDFK